MLSAVTLIHKGAMPIGIHAVRSFARHFTGTAVLRIHSDGSLDAEDEATLLREAGTMPAEIVRPGHREPLLRERLAGYPLTRELLGRGAYFTKMQIPVCETTPYFFFDSDIVWLSPVENLRPEGVLNAFSTESWSWYYGVSDDAAWIRDRVPRRVNSGFYYLGEAFPFNRMEHMLRERHFDPELPDNTDQEIMAYLYRDMVHYHPDDLKRTRVGRIYSLADESCSALHFPGRMWRGHLDQIEQLGRTNPPTPKRIRFASPVPLGRLELFRMRAFMTICTLRCIQEPLNGIRRMRNFLK